MARFLRKAKYWATFVETPQHETLFTGIYESKADSPNE
jgi:hypothetical protein